MGRVGTGERLVGEGLAQSGGWYGKYIGGTGKVWKVR